MKIQRLKLKDFGLFQDEEIRFEKPLTLILGLNATGKSTIADAILMALTGGARFNLKKDAARFTRTGAKEFELEADAAAPSHEDSLQIRRLPDRCNHTKADIEAFLGASEAVIRAAFDVHSFLNLDTQERKKLLFRLLGLELTPESLAPILKDAGVPEPIMREITRQPMNPKKLQDYCVEKRRQGKRDREALEGAQTWDPEASVETHKGSRKIKGLPLETVRDVEKALEADYQKAVETLGLAKIGCSEDEVKAEIAEVEGTIEKAKKVQAERLGVEKKLAAVRDKVRRERQTRENNIKQAAACQATAENHESYAMALAQSEGRCPICGVKLEPEAAKTRVTELHRKAQESTAQARSYSQVAETQRTEIVSLEKEEAGLLLAFKQETQSMEPLLARRRELQLELAKTGAIDLAGLENTVDDLQARRGKARTALVAIEAWHKAKEVSTSGIEAVKCKAVEIEAWDRAEKIFAPDGAVGRKVVEGIGPVLARLKSQILLAPVEIDDDLAITVGRVPERALSTSERYRLGLVMADALAQLSGVRFLVLDEFSVLDKGNRAAGLSFLAKRLKDYDQTILLGTLQDKLPESWPDWMDVILIEGGRVQQLAMAQ